jgi:hypothetical protein
MRLASHATQNGNSGISSNGGAQAWAGRMLVRALLSDEYGPMVRDRLRPDLFADGQTGRLVAALLPLVQQNLASSEVLARLTDPALADHADALLLADHAEPLSEQVIEDCLRRLVHFQTVRDLNKIRAESEQHAEGKPAKDDELLRRWHPMARRTKLGSNGSDDQGEEDAAGMDGK